MQAKPFTLSVIVAMVVGGVSLLSATIDRHDADFRPVVAPVRTLVQPVESPLSTASPIDIDPRRMEAPAETSEAARDEPTVRKVAVDSRT